MTETTKPVQPLRFYSEEELDQLEEDKPELAYQIARAQAMAQRASTSKEEALKHPPPSKKQIEEAILDIRQVLLRDGGDIELFEIEQRTVFVRMKGACAGCPNVALDIKNVVEKIMRGRCPGVIEVKNIF